MRKFDLPDPRDRHYVCCADAHEKIAQYIANHSWDYFDGVHFESRLDLASSMSVDAMLMETEGGETEDANILLERLVASFRDELPYLQSSPPGQLPELLADEYVYVACHQGEVWVAKMPFFAFPQFERLEAQGEPIPPDPPAAEEFFDIG